MIKLSIITINRNDVDGLTKTIQSVLGQTSLDFEYIIIDGASKDGSLDFIERISDDRLAYFISEPDSGIYNAMNKGIKKAKGEYCLFLNSGDWFVDSDVIAEILSHDFNSDFVSANMNCVDKNELVRIFKSPEILSFDYFWWKSLPHQSTFIKRELFDLYGLYNEKLNFFSDWEFCLKTLLLNNRSYAYINTILVNFDINGISSSRDEKLIEQKEKERELIFQQLMPILYKSFKDLKLENERLTHIEKEYNFLIKGRLGYIIKSMKYFKKLSKFRVHL